MAYLSACFKTEGNNVTLRCLRELTPEQLSTFNDHHDAFCKLRQRLSLLNILEGNFISLDRHIQQCEASQGAFVIRDWTELNRHFMNYLSSGYALREHLETAVIRDFGRHSDFRTKFRELLHQLEEKCFAYAFIQDFRNYVQHCGFPVGEVNYQQTPAGAKLSLTYHRRDLLKQYAGWDKSKLQLRAEQQLDLIPLSRAHHQLAKNEFADAIIAMYATDFETVEKYFLDLQAEAKAFKIDSHARLVVDVKDNPECGANILLEDIPLDPAKELGLTWNRK